MLPHPTRPYLKGIQPTVNAAKTTKTLRNSDAKLSTKIARFELLKMESDGGVMTTGGGVCSPSVGWLAGPAPLNHRIATISTPLHTLPALDHQPHCATAHLVVGAICR